MAESSGQSTGGKRKATAESAPIEQLRFSQLCRCAGCWKASVRRPLGRRSARLAAKQQNRDHERRCSKNAVVYEICGFAEASHWPTGGRHLYRISTERLTIVDLLRNTFKQLRPRAWWNRDAYITDMSVVGPYAILVSIHVRDVQRDELHLLRLTKDGDDYKRTLLHGAEDSDLSAFALVQITGQGVDVKRAVVGGVWGGPIVFLTADIDRARAVVVDTTGHPFRESQARESQAREFAAHFNDDGRELLAIHKEHPQVLQVYSLAERKWTKHELDGLEGGHNTFFWYRFSPSGRIYAHGDEAGTREFLFRCDVERKKWERVPVEAPEIGDVAFVANSADGREDGVLICKTEEMPSNSLGQAVDRLRIERRMFRQPDSLLRQAFVAVRKLREGVHVEEVIRELVEAAGMPSAVLQKKFFPSAYDGMTPIPVRFHH